MIINSMADAQVTASDLIEFNFRPIAFTIAGSKSKLSGEVPANAFQNIDATLTGEGPYKVTLGYVNHSYQADPVTVESNDALVTFWMAFPAGPNGPKTFVFDKI